MRVCLPVGPSVCLCRCYDMGGLSCFSVPLLRCLRKCVLVRISVCLSVCVLATVCGDHILASYRPSVLTSFLRPILKPSLFTPRGLHVFGAFIASGLSSTSKSSPLTNCFLVQVRLSAHRPVGLSLWRPWCAMLQHVQASHSHQLATSLRPSVNTRPFLLPCLLHAPRGGEEEGEGCWRGRERRCCKGWRGREGKGKEGEGRKGEGWGEEKLGVEIISGDI